MAAKRGDVLCPDDLRRSGGDGRTKDAGDQLVPAEFADEDEPEAEQDDEMDRPGQRTTFLTPSGHEPLSAIHADPRSKGTVVP